MLNTVEHVQDVHGVWVLFSVLVPRFDDVHYGRVLRGGHHGELQPLSYFRMGDWTDGACVLFVTGYVCESIHAGKFILTLVWAISMTSCVFC